MPPWTPSRSARSAPATPLPTDKLEAFIKETKHAPAARRLAYEWLTRIDQTMPGRLLPGMLNDPSVELRRDAVAVVLKEARQKLEKKDRDGARTAFKKALGGARDQDQVEAIAKALKELGEPVDIAAHFGFVRTWQLIGPFDSTGRQGLRRRLRAGKEGRPGRRRWPARAARRCAGRRTRPTDPYGTVDLNKAIGKNMGAAGYAYAVLESPAERAVEVRVRRPRTPSRSSSTAGRSSPRRSITTGSISISTSPASRCTRAATPFS